MRTYCCCSVLSPLGVLLQCGCQCTKCCFNGDRSNCTSVELGTCQYDCLERNKSSCGVQFSTPQQSVFCAIPHTSSWPAILQVTAGQHRAGQGRAVCGRAGQQHSWLTLGLLCTALYRCCSGGRVQAHTNLSKHLICSSAVQCCHVGRQWQTGIAHKHMCTHTPTACHAAACVPAACCPPCRSDPE